MIKTCIDRIEFNLERVKMNMSNNCLLIRDKSLVNNIKSDIQRLAVEYNNRNTFITNQLNEIVEKLFPDNFKINTYRVGMLDMLIKLIKEEYCNNIWHKIHPKIREVTEMKFHNKFYKDASNSAFIEICSIVRDFRKAVGRSDLPSDLDMLRNSFSKNNNFLKFTDCNDVTEKSIQEGYENLLYGAIQAIRNPRSHRNNEDTEQQALTYILLASDLLHRIDIAINNYKKTTTK